ncbi:MAG: hypothetical protein H0X13_15485 [Ramlibacter sp.]|nr:hypothetical protein [Ramlibacter sp.]
MSKSGSKGASETAKKDPWEPAAPWLKQNLQTGQDLQGYYQRNPFNQQQQNAHGNLSAGTNYMNQLVPGLLQQMSGARGFDRRNPLGRQAGTMFPQQPSMLNSGFGSGPMTGQNNMNFWNNPFANGGIQAPAPAPAPALPAPWTDWLSGQGGGPGNGSDGGGPGGGDSAGGGGSW